MKKAMNPLFVLSILLLASCMVPPSDPSTAKRITPQATDTPVPSSNPTVTTTWTPEPTIAPTLTSIQTWTPLPTLSTQEKNEKIKELLETNGGCRLPCWWGITPNKTIWSETLHFLRPIIFQLEQGTTNVYSENDKEHKYTNFQFLYNVPGETQSARIELGVKDDIVVGLVVYAPGAEYKYQLHQLLALLGPPEQILINAQSSSPISELPPTVFTLDYGNVGVWALYGYVPARVGEDLVICPESSLGKVSIYDNLGGRLRLFDPKMEPSNALSIEEYANMVGGFSAKKLEDATNMTVESFYNTFINPKPEKCLETPAKLWP